MTTIRPIRDVLSTHPDFGEKIGWRSKSGETPSEDYVIGNPRFGIKVRHVAVCDEEGAPIYDLGEISEGPGSIVLAYTGRRRIPWPWSGGTQQRIAILRVKRPIVIDQYGNQGNVISLELPRGYGVTGEDRSETALRKLLQFMGTDIVEKVQYLGPINPLTSLYGPSNVNEAIAVRLDGEAVDKLKADASLVDRLGSDEGLVAGIKKVLAAEFVPALEVRGSICNGEIICGLSLATLMYGQANGLIHLRWA
ncbi:MAG: hypothetical protein AABW49_01405 [Nanoarchaeota archaeon]